MNYASTELKPVFEPLPSAQWQRVTTLAGSPAWAVDAYRAISRLAELPSGWDTQASPPLQESAKDSASRVIEELERYDELPSPHIAPTVGGGLGIEWHHGPRELDVEILPDGSMEYLKTEVRAIGGYQMEDGQVSPNSLREELRKLARWLMTGA